MPSIAVTRPYEAIYIIRPDATEEVVETTVNKYRNVVQNSGGTVTKIDRWERRKLAYEVSGYNEGLYVVMEFVGESRAEVELRRQFQISEDQIRYMIVSREAAEGSVPAVTVAAAQPPVSAAISVAEPAPAEPSEETQAPETEEAPLEADAAV